MARSLVWLICARKVGPNRGELFRCCASFTCCCRRAHVQGPLEFYLMPKGFLRPLRFNTLNAIFPMSFSSQMMVRFARVDHIVEKRVKGHSKSGSEEERLATVDGPL
jgi:hypothetical protein